MDRTRGLDNEAIMRAKHANPLLTAALQLNTSLTRGLADTRRDSAVAIASAEVDLTSSSSRSVSSRNKSYLVPEYREESIPLQSTICTTNSSMQEKIDMQSKQQDPSVDDKDDDIASNIAGDNSDQKKKKKKKKKTKSSSSSTVVDQQQTAEIFQSRTTDPRQVVSSSQQHATPTTSSTDQLNTVGAKQEEHSHNGLTEESLEWLESAVVRGDTKPKGKRSKAKKKPAAKKTTTTLLPHNSSASTSDHDPLDDDEEGVKTLMEINDDDAKADGDDDTSTRLESTVKNFSLAGNNSAVLSHMDDLAFLDDDFLGGGGGSGNWADDVEDFVCQITGPAASSPSTNLSSSIGTSCCSSQLLVHESHSANVSHGSGISSRPSQDVRLSGTGDERMDQSQWGHPKRNTPSPSHSARHFHGNSSRRAGSQERLRPARQQELKKQRQHQGTPLSDESLQRSQCSTHLQHQNPSQNRRPLGNKQAGQRNHYKASLNNQSNVDTQRLIATASSTTSTTNTSPRYADDADANSHQGYASQRPRSVSESVPPLVDVSEPDPWKDRAKVIELLSSRWNAALASVESGTAVYYTSS